MSGMAAVCLTMVVSEEGLRAEDDFESKMHGEELGWECLEN